MEEKKNEQTPGTDERAQKFTALPKFTIGGIVALILGILIFAGVFAHIQGYEWLKAFDYSTLIGKFGTMRDPAKNTFIGAGGVSARAGFLFALSLIPSIMLAIGIVNVLQHYGALSAAQKLMTPLFKPLMDVPGLVGLTLITDLQSTDAGAALTKELYDLGLVDKREETIIAAWQYSGAGMINNYFAIAGAVFGFMACPILIPLAIIFVMKFVGAIICRIALDTIYKGDFKHDN